MEKKRNSHGDDDREEENRLTHPFATTKSIGPFLKVEKTLTSSPKSDFTVEMHTPANSAENEHESGRNGRNHHITPSLSRLAEENHSCGSSYSAFN